jgi:hypothetical protein
MLQDMNPKRNSLCGISFVFSLEKLGMWWVTNNFTLYPFWSRYK